MKNRVLNDFTKKRRKSTVNFEHRPSWKRSYWYLYFLVVDGHDHFVRVLLQLRRLEFDDGRYFHARRNGQLGILVLQLKHFIAGPKQLHSFALVAHIFDVESPGELFVQLYVLEQDLSGLNYNFELV